MCIFFKPISITAHLLIWPKSGDNTCPLVLVMIISKPLCSSFVGSCCGRAEPLQYPSIMIPCLLNFCTFDSFGTASSKTAQALNLHYVPFYLTASSSSSLHSPAPYLPSAKKTLLHHGLILLLRCIGSLLPIFLLR